MSPHGNRGRLSWATVFAIEVLVCLRCGGPRRSPGAVTDRTPCAILGTNLNAALAGLSTPEDAMSKAAGEIRALMKKAGY